MSYLWLPENEHDEHIAQGRAIDHLASAVEFRRQLQDIDSRLDLVWAGEGARGVPQDERWYIVRRADSGIGAMWQVCGPQGEYCDPDERHLDALMAQDGERHPHIWRRIKAGREERRRARERAQAQRSEHFTESLLDRLDHLHNARISVQRDITAATSEQQFHEDMQASPFVQNAKAPAEPVSAG